MRDAIGLTDSELEELTRRAKSRTGRAEDARRARLILLLAEGHTWDEVSERIDCSRGFVASWSRRFTEQRIAGLCSRHLGQAPPYSPRNWKHGFWRRHDMYRRVEQPTGARANSERIWRSAT